MGKSNNTYVAYKLRYKTLPQKQIPHNRISCKRAVYLAGLLAQLDSFGGTRWDCRLGSLLMCAGEEKEEAGVTGKAGCTYSLHGIFPTFH